MQSEELLEVAKGTERWIGRFSDNTEAGRRWGFAREKADRYIYTLYAGSAGIGLFYLELYKALGESHYLEAAVAAGDELLVQLPNAL